MSISCRTADSPGHYTQVDIICPKKERKKKKKTVSGALRFYQFKTDVQYSLHDYVRGGLAVRLIVAIDFTSSNGPVTDTLSLHNVTNILSNHYMYAFNTVAEAILQYDLEQKIAVFGFGAKKTSKDFTRQCFPLSKNENNVFVRGLKGVEEVYKRAVEELEFSGPTELSHIIEKAMNMTREDMCTQDNQTYYTLLIITDGITNDYDKTLERLIDSSELPLSVIIIGLGPSEFSFMEHAQQSHLPVNTYKGKKVACRCNTQFLVMKKHSLSESGRAAVARECMAALSKQIVQFLKDRLITPNKPMLRYSLRRKSKNKWVDGGSALEDRRSLSGSMVLSEIYNQPGRSNNKAKSVEGPVCPTCGSMLSLNDEINFL